MKKTQKLSRKEKWKRYPYRLAHHPLCDHFADHVYTIRGYKVCRGCFNLYSGMIIGLILAPIAVFVLNITFWISFIATNVLYIFTPLCIIFDPPRIIKDFSRFLLGIAMISNVLSIILAIVELILDLNYGAIAVIILSIAIYTASRAYFRKIRDKRNENVCRSCEQFYLPRCDGMKKPVAKTDSLEKK